MGTVDIEETIDEVIQSSNLEWDGENPSYEEMESIIREVVTKVTEDHYSQNGGEIDDWDLWEYDVMYEINKRLNN